MAYGLRGHWYFFDLGTLFSSGTAQLRRHP